MNFILIIHPFTVLLDKVGSIEGNKIKEVLF
jgi:hypothetical protein